MLNRDFNRSASAYLNRNKFVLIVIAVMLIVGVTMIGVFGFNGNSELSGYNTFNVNIGVSYKQSKLNDYVNEIKLDVIDHDATLETVQVSGEGDQLCLVVKYLGKIKDQTAFNEALAEDLQLNSTQITSHSKVDASIDSKDYIYTVACGLVIIALVALFAAFRYNLACTMTSIVSSLLTVALLLSLTAIFRLNVGSSFLAINLFSVILVLLENLVMFDSLEKARNNLKDKKDRSTQLTNALKENSFRKQFMYCAIFAVSLLLVILAPSPVKRAGLVVMFAVITVLFASAYLIPFVWCLTINKVNDKIRIRKVEKKVAQTNTNVEGELEEQYTENQVIEVKEDSDDTIPSNDDNITID